MNGSHMQYRKLGNTGFEVSAVGFGAAMLGSSNIEYAVKVVRRALELGVNFFDTARGYWDSEIKLGLAGKKIHLYIERLKTDYLHNSHIHVLSVGEDL